MLKVITGLMLGISIVACSPEQTTMANSQLSKLANGKMTEREVSVMAAMLKEDAKKSAGKILSKGELEQLIKDTIANAENGNDKARFVIAMASKAAKDLPTTGPCWGGHGEQCINQIKNLMKRDTFMADVEKFAEEKGLPLK